MGIKYQVYSHKTHKAVKRVKGAWAVYKRKKCYELQVWEGKGKGWKTVGTSRK